MYHLLPPPLASFISHSPSASVLMKYSKDSPASRSRPSPRPLQTRCQLLCRTLACRRIRTIAQPQTVRGVMKMCWWMEMFRIQRNKVPPPLRAHPGRANNILAADCAPQKTVFTASSPSSRVTVWQPSRAVEFSSPSLRLLFVLRLLIIYWLEGKCPFIANNKDYRSWLVLFS